MILGLEITWDGFMIANIFPVVSDGLPCAMLLRLQCQCHLKKLKHGVLPIVGKMKDKE